MSGLLSASIPPLALRLDTADADIFALIFAPAAVAVLLAHPRRWPDSYAWNAAAVVVGSAVSLAAAAAIIDPSEHDSNLAFFTIVVFCFAAGLALLGVALLLPLAWIANRIAALLSDRSRPD